MDPELECPVISETKSAHFPRQDFFSEKLRALPIFLFHCVEYEEKYVKLLLPPPEIYPSALTNVRIWHFN